MSLLLDLGLTLGRAACARGLRDFAVTFRLDWFSGIFLIERTKRYVYRRGRKETSQHSSPTIRACRNGSLRVDP